MRGSTGGVCWKCTGRLPHFGVHACPHCGWLWPARRSPPKHIKRKVIKAQGGACAHCGAVEALTIHHIIQLAEGGTHKLANLEALCGACHKNQHGAAPTPNQAAR